MNCTTPCCSCSCPPQPQAVEAQGVTLPVIAQPTAVGSSPEQMMTGSPSVPFNPQPGGGLAVFGFTTPPPTDQSQPLLPPSYTPHDPNPWHAPLSEPPPEEGTEQPMGAVGGKGGTDKKDKQSPRFGRPGSPAASAAAPRMGGVGGTGGAGGVGGINAPADTAPLTPLERLRNLLSTFLPTLNLTFQYDEPENDYTTSRQVTDLLPNILRELDLTGNGLNISVPIAQAINANPALRAAGFSAEVWYLPLASRTGELMNLTDAEAAIQRPCNHAMVAITAPSTIRGPSSDVPFLLDVATSNYLSENIMLCGNWSDFKEFIRHKLAKDPATHSLVLNPEEPENTQINHNVSIYNSGNQSVGEMLTRYFRQEAVNLDILAAGMHQAWYGNNEPSDLETDQS